MPSDSLPLAKPGADVDGKAGFASRRLIIARAPGESGTELFEDWPVLGREAEEGYWLVAVEVFILAELPCRDCPGGESDVEADGLLTSNNGAGTWRSTFVAEGRSVLGTKGVGGEGDASDGFLRAEAGLAE